MVGTVASMDCQGENDESLEDLEGGSHFSGDWKSRTLLYEVLSEESPNKVLNSSESPF